MSARHKATRRFSPPDSLDTIAVAGGKLRAAIARSTLASKSHAPQSSSLVNSEACSSTNPSMASSLVSSQPMASFTSSKRFRRAAASPAPPATLPRTSKASSSSGSWARYVTLVPGRIDTRPSKLVPRPASSFSRVDLPAPFGPTIPTQVLESKERLTSLNSVRPSGSLLVTPCSSITLSPRVTLRLLRGRRRFDPANRPLPLKLEEA
mmetsp:Transcript_16632/g.32994  ORF Transcript_16632/g.32994 Transcript_16632/m.32994 type:complete len:208 (-) Transcript_16632:123-746(-)